MTFATMTFWLVMIVFAAVGVYRLLGGLVGPDRLNWILLPGTLVSELAYVLGCLLTGGDARRVGLLGDRARGAQSAGASPSPVRGLRKLGPLVGSLLAIAACAAGILLVRAALGQPLIEKFTLLGSDTQLPRRLPTTTGEFWNQLEGQVRLLRRMGQSWLELHWLHWRVPLFVYLAGCLSIRIAPTARPLRPTLAAAVLLALLVALAGLVSRRLEDLADDLWPLLSYLWASLLFFLALALLLHGLLALLRVLAGKAR